MLYVGTLILVSRWVSQPLQPTTSTYKEKTQAPHCNLGRLPPVA